MFSLISLNTSIGSRFIANARQVALTSAIITLVTALLAYGLHEGFGSFLQPIPLAGYITGGVAFVFFGDAIRFLILSCKKPVVIPLIQENSFEMSHLSATRLDVPHLRVKPFFHVNHCYEIPYDSKWTIAILKQQIAFKIGISENSQVIYLGSKIVDDAESLENLHEKIDELTWQPCLIVRSPFNSRNYHVPLDPKWTIKKLKEEIATKIEIPEQFFRIFVDRNLEDSINSLKKEEFNDFTIKPKNIAECVAQLKQG